MYSELLITNIKEWAFKWKTNFEFQEKQSVIFQFCRINNSKKDYLTLTVGHNEVEKWEKKWEIGKTLATRTRMTKLKFSSKIWRWYLCQLYNLGFRTLNKDDQLYLKFSDSEKIKSK